MEYFDRITAINGVESYVSHLKCSGFTDEQIVVMMRDLTVSILKNL